MTPPITSVSHPLSSPLRWGGLCLGLIALQLFWGSEHPMLQPAELLSLPPGDRLQAVRFELPGYPPLILERSAPGEGEPSTLWRGRLAGQSTHPLAPRVLMSLLDALADEQRALRQLQLPPLREKGAAALRRRYGLSEAAPLLELTYRRVASSTRELEGEGRIATGEGKIQRIRLLVGRELDQRRTWVAIAPSPGARSGALELHQLPSALRSPLTRPPEEWIDLQITPRSFGALQTITLSAGLGGEERWQVSRAREGAPWHPMSGPPSQLAQALVDGLSSTL